MTPSLKLPYALYVLKFLVVFVLSSSIVSQALGGISVGHDGAFEEEYLLVNVYPTILVVIIKGVDRNSKNTNCDPPRLRVEIEEIIKGCVGKLSLSAVWRPYPHDVDWVGSDSKEMIRKWNRQPNLPPPVGSRWILSGNITENNTFYATPKGRYPFTEKKLRWLKSVLKK